MYSVVLMAALTTAPSTQAWHRGCHRCHGCYATSCYVSCSGCYRCSGCNGCYATWGCYGCHGWVGYGAAYSGVVVCHGCYGCYGGWSCYGYLNPPAVAEPAPPSMTPAERVGQPKGKVEETPPPRELEKKGGNEQARARVIIDLPAGAKLFVDDQEMKLGNGRRVFQTPALVPGQTYFYDLRAELVRNGQTVRATQRIILRPGQEAVASFADLGQTRDATANAARE